MEFPTSNIKTALSTWEFKTAFLNSKPSLLQRWRTLNYRVYAVQIDYLLNTRGGGDPSCKSLGS